MNQSTYLFYDVETTGLNPCFDQVVQFAAIRTDLNLKEIARQQFYIRLNRDVIPSPGAFITHRIQLAQLQAGISEWQAMQQIHLLFNQPGTISIGYNNLGFDDLFLRFSFYRNLLSPYSHQYANGCKRMDLYPIVVLYYLYQHDSLHWPFDDSIDKNGNEQHSLQLARLSEINQLGEGQAHDAMVDVERTVALARKLSQRKKMWDYVIGFFDKTAELRRQQQLEKLPGLGQQALLIAPKIGREKRYQTAALQLGQHYHYKNQMLWLRCDLPALADSTLDSIPESTRIIAKKAGEKGFLLPYHTRFMQHFSTDRQQIIQDNLAFLLAQPKLYQAIRDYHLDRRYPEIENLHAKAALYQGFLSSSEQQWSQQFHAANWPQRVELFARAVSDRSYELALAIIANNQPNQLTVSAQSHFLQSLQSLKQPSENNPLDYRGNAAYTLPQAIRETESLTRDPNLDPEQQQLLQQLLVYYATW